MHGLCCASCACDSASTSGDGDRAHHGGHRGLHAGRLHGCCWSSAGLVVSCCQGWMQRMEIDERVIRVGLCCLLPVSPTFRRPVCVRAFHWTTGALAIPSAGGAGTGREHELEPPSDPWLASMVRASPLRTLKRTNGDCCTRRRPRRPHSASARNRRSPPSPSPVGSAVPKPRAHTAPESSDRDRRTVTTHHSPAGSGLNGPADP